MGTVCTCTLQQMMTLHILEPGVHYMGQNSCPPRLIQSVWYEPVSSIFGKGWSHGNRCAVTVDAMYQRTLFKYMVSFRLAVDNARPLVTMPIATSLRSTPETHLCKNHASPLHGPNIERSSQEFLTFRRTCMHDLMHKRPPQ